jgi:hypothetical protein
LFSFDDSSFKFLEFHFMLEQHWLQEIAYLRICKNSDPHLYLLVSAVV